MAQKQKFIENKNSATYKNNPKIRANKRKKISPHTKKDLSAKLNRNGHTTKRIAGNSLQNKPKKLATLDYSDPESIRNHLNKENSNRKFKDKIFNKDNYSRFLYYPAIILFLSLLIDFVLQFVVYGVVDPIFVNMAKNSLFFVTVAFFLMATNISCYLYLGFSGAKYNYKFWKVFKKVLLLALAFILIEGIFTIVAYYTFLQPYLLQTFSSLAIRQSYLIYLILWILLKAIMYLLFMLSSYFVFYKLKFVKI